MKTASEVANEWQVFEIKYGVPRFSYLIDNMIAVFLKKFVIDIAKFDEWLHEKFGNYEDEGKSMSKILSEKYGDDIKNYVEQMIGQVKGESNKPMNSKQIFSNYKQIKAKYPDALLLFRSARHYIALNNDAKTVAKICGTQLNNTLTKFEYHKLDDYLPKLVRAGNRVAICE